jgi:3',5'-cyclic AMP phosphodiesterase CpdA
LTLHFVVLGDFGSGLPGQYDVAARLCAWRRTHPFDLVITTGDNVYDTGDPARFDEVFFRPYSCLLDRGVRFRASLGNHDIVTDDGRPEIREPAFGIKGHNYVVRKGGVRFVIADSNHLDVAWLRQALVGEPGDRWKIVVMHHPVYSSGSEHGSTPGMRPELPRLFRSKGVDLVLNGHDHNYEVTKPLRGIRYVVTGGGGASIRSCMPGMYFSDVCLPRYHFLWIRVNDTRINVKAIPARGRAIDSFTTTGLD